MAAVQRETLYALNADVVNYSRLMADDEEATSHAMAQCRAQVGAAISDHHGRLVNFVGDNFMAVFPRATDAVRAGIDIAIARERANDELTQPRQLRFRMGIDRGLVRISADDYEGEALNVAARIQALARPGGLSVSGGVYSALDEPALRFRPVGARRLKNIPEPVEVYEFADLPTHGRDEAVTPLSLSLPTMAVLPLHLDEVPTDVAAACQVIRDDLIHRLAGIPELKVIDAGEPGPTPSIGARYILETRVYVAGDRLRVHSTVIDVTTMNIVKGHRESGTLDGLLDLSDTLAEHVGRTVEIELVVGAPAGLYAELDDPEAIQRVYMGWYHLRSNTREGWSQALPLFGQVAASHPELPYGWALSAYANWLGATSGWTPDADAALTTAREQARRGQQLGDPTGMAQAVDAAVLMWMGRIPEAIKTVDGLEIARPTCDVTYGLEGSLNRYLGRWEKAVDLMNTAIRLTAVAKPWYPTVLACSWLLGERPEQASAAAESVLESQPDNIEALLVLAASQVELGQTRRSEATATTIRSRFPGLDVADWLDNQPYQDPDLVRRWRADLASLGLMEVSA
jgi:adenylate cyclase